jgi:hypothetical protein
VSPDTKAKRTEQMQQSMNQFDQARLNAPDLSMLKDTLTFVPDPYRGLPFRKRVVPGFNWQIQQAQGYFPATIDFAFTLGYRVNKRLMPNIGAAYKLGIGESWDNIYLSDQGFSLRGGAEYLFHPQVAAFASYEHTWLRNHSRMETRDRYISLPGIVIGFSIKSKIKLMIGYDVLYHAYPQKPSPFIFRIGL